MPSQDYVLSADVGGTFTDIIVAASDGRYLCSKVLSTPPNFGRAIVSGAMRLLKENGIAPVQVKRAVHASTVATNAVLEHRGAPTALVTTKGFRDVLELARQRRPSLFDVRWVKPKPLVPRQLRFELDERIDAGGNVTKPLDVAEVEELADRLAEERIEAVGVCLINSFLNSAHEQEVCRILRERLPVLRISGSYEILSQLGEYERTSTTVVNAYIQPAVDQYVADLQRQLAEAGLACELQIMQSNGALLDSNTIRRAPVRMVESGPAGGVTAASALASSLGLPNVIAFDMGGTTAKATFIENGQPAEASEYDVGAEMNSNRLLMRGGGYTLRVASMDISEVGAGGGSIVWIDEGGMPHVGPQSAGAMPGPVCYGAGGAQPTVTDANLILGYLDDMALAGGNQRIDRQLATKVFEEQIAAPLGLDLLSAAYGVHSIANVNMSKAVAAVSLERGRDPREAALVAFGGAGPMHAARLAEEFGIRRVIVPPNAGLFSAVGLQLADVRYDYATSYPQPRSRDPETIFAMFSRMEHTAAAELTTAGYDAGEIVFEHALDQRYRGQSFDLRVSLERLDERALARAEAAFHTEHERTYGHRSEASPIDLTTLNLRALVRITKRVARFGTEADAPPPRRRDVFFGPESGLRDTPVVDRASIGAEYRTGPLIVQDMDCTIVVPPAWTARRDPAGNLFIETSGSE